jgi:hypothetical protein
VPLASTEKLARSPALTVAAVGAVVISGGECTVMVARVLVATPALLVAVAW